MPGMVSGNLLLGLQEAFMMSHGSNNEGEESVFVLEGRTTSHFSRIFKPVIAEANRHRFQYSPEFNAGHTIEPDRFNVSHISFDMDSRISYTYPLLYIRWEITLLG